MDKNYKNMDLIEFLTTLDISDQEILVLVTHICSLSSVSYNEGFTQAIELATGLSREDEKLVGVIKDCSKFDVPEMAYAMMKMINNIKEGESKEC